MVAPTRLAAHGGVTFVVRLATNTAGLGVATNFGARLVPGSGGRVPTETIMPVKPDRERFHNPCWRVVSAYAAAIL